MIHVESQGTSNAILQHGTSSEDTVMGVVHPISGVQKTREIVQTTPIAFQAWCVVARTARRILALVIGLIAVNPFLTYSDQVRPPVLSNMSFLWFTHM